VLEVGIVNLDNFVWRCFTESRKERRNGDISRHPPAQPGHGNPAVYRGQVGRGEDRDPLEVRREREGQEHGPQGHGVHGRQMCPCCPHVWAAENRPGIPHESLRLRSDGGHGQTAGEWRRISTQQGEHASSLCWRAFSVMKICYTK